MTEQTSITRTKAQKWQRGILVGSLALNLLIAGVFAGAVLKGGKPGHQQRFDLTVGPLTRAMEDDRRDAVRDALRDSGAFRRVDRDGMRADMAALLVTLRAAEFDEDAFRQALMRQRARLQLAQDAVLEAITTEIDGMSVDERGAFADRLEEQARRAPPPRR